MANKNYVHAQTQTWDNYAEYSSITTKQWKVYYYLLSISLFDSQCVEDHRYVYKKKFNVSEASRFLNITRPTFYSALNALKKKGLITEMSKSYLIYAKQWVKIDREVLKALLSFQQDSDIDLLRTYLLLKKMNQIAQEPEDREFTKRSIIILLGHNPAKSEYYDKIKTYIALLTYWNMITVKIETRYHEQFGRYTVYHLHETNENNVNPDLITDVAAEMIENVMPQKVFDTLSFTMPGLVKEK